MDHLSTEQIRNNHAAAQAELTTLESGGPDYGGGLPKCPDYRKGASDAENEAVRLARCAIGEMEQPIKDRHAERIRHLKGAIYAMQFEMTEKRGARV
jgi:hypothetical protein